MCVLHTLSTISAMACRSVSSQPGGAIYWKCVEHSTTDQNISNVPGRPSRREATWRSVRCRPVRPFSGAIILRSSMSRVKPRCWVRIYICVSTCSFITVLKWFAAPQLARLVAKGGYIIYQHFVDGVQHSRVGRPNQPKVCNHHTHIGPRKSQYSNPLLAYFSNISSTGSSRKYCVGSTGSRACSIPSMC